MRCVRSHHCMCHVPHVFLAVRRGLVAPSQQRCRACGWARACVFRACSRCLATGAWPAPCGAVCSARAFVLRLGTSFAFFLSWEVETSCRACCSLLWLWAGLMGLFVGVLFGDVVGQFVGSIESLLACGPAARATYTTHTSAGSPDARRQTEPSRRTLYPYLYHYESDPACARHLLARWGERTTVLTVTCPQRCRSQHNLPHATRALRHPPSCLPCQICCLLCYPLSTILFL